jgi:uncharacterized glyoxalase superfamily protein PhnB
VTASLFAYLSYADAAAALEWLTAVGFEVVRRQDGADGTVVHGEVRWGDAVVMVASADAPYVKAPLVGRSTGDGLHLHLPDAAAVDAFAAAAQDAGGRVVVAPEDTEWGTRRTRVLDPGGAEWSAGTYQPGAEW